LYLLSYFRRQKRSHDSRSFLIAREFASDSCRLLKRSVLCAEYFLVQLIDIVAGVVQHNVPGLYPGGIVGPHSRGLTAVGAHLARVDVGGTGERQPVKFH
jgi:hypothetical protein